MANRQFDSFVEPKFKMNPEIKAKWLKALRSGKYQQTSNDLRNNRGMCCLGVLCDIVHPEKWERKKDFDLFPVWYYRGDDEKVSSLPPPELCREVGLPDFMYSNELNEPTITRYLADLNDSGHSFLQIANFIEENL